MTNPIDRLSKLINQPDSWNFVGAERFYAGIDLGTYKTIAIIIDETGMPRAARMRRTEIARSGLIVDYVGALNTTRELMEEMRKHCPVPIEQGATSFPPQTEYANLKTTTHILEGVGLVVHAAQGSTAAVVRDVALGDAGVEAMGLGRANVGEVPRPQPLEDHVHPLGALKGSHKPAFGQFRLCITQAVVFGIDRDHGAR